MNRSPLDSAIASLGAAVSGVKKLIVLRDFTLVAETAAKLSDQLLQAQQALLAHQATMFELHDKYFKACQEIREISETLSKRGGYTLVEVVPGRFAYQADLPPVPGHVVEPGAPKRHYFICQRCFNKGREIVLQRYAAGRDRFVWVCSECKDRLPAAIE